MDWAFDEIAELGEVDVPSGRVGGTDPSFHEDLFAWTLDVPAGAYPVRIATARESAEGRTFPAGAELRLTPETGAETWEPLGDEPFVPSNSIWGIADCEIVEPREDAIESYFAAVLSFLQSGSGQEWLAPAMVVANGARLAMAPMVLQHHPCRSWLARGVGGEPRRVVTELGLLDIDPLRDGRVPWD